MIKFFHGLFLVMMGSALTIIALLLLKSLYQKWTKTVLSKFKGQKLIAASISANFFGQESLGYKQFRGNGVLVLTEKELYFELCMPKKEIHILNSDIIDVESPKTHLGKTKFMPLLKIIFKNKKGQDDSVAWVVDNLPYWKETLEAIIKKGS